MIDGDDELYGDLDDATVAKQTKKSNNLNGKNQVTKKRTIMIRPNAATTILFDSYHQSQNP